MELLLTLIWTVVLLGLIVLACMVFTNAIEWAGEHFNLSHGAVGSVLAAVGTALPETMVPIIAIVSGMMTGTDVGREAGQAIGIGAILGAPFLLSTLAMHISAVAVFYFAARRQRSLSLHINSHLFKRDFLYFFASYVLVFLAAFIHDDTVKKVIAAGLLVFYGIYVYRTLKKEHIPDEEFELEPLYFQPKAKTPGTLPIIAQILVGLGGIIVLAHLFVEDIHHLSATLQLDAMLISLIVMPIATELPEKFNSVLWLSNKKDSLAMGNITGAMVFQSCIPGAIGLAFTPWVLSQQAVLSVILCLASSLVIFTATFYRKGLIYALLAGGLFYLVFLVYSLFGIGLIQLPGA